MSKVLIIIGSKSDEEVMKECQKYLDWLETVKSPPEWEYKLTSEITVAPDIPEIMVESKIFRFPRELTASEEARLETAVEMKIKNKRKKL